MMTAVGLSAAETAASVRAGIMRFLETAWMDDALEPFRMALVIDDALQDLDPGLATEVPARSREARLLRLATQPLRECLAPVAGFPRPMGLLLALPEMEARPPLDGRALIRRLARQAGAPLDLARSSSEFRGRAGGLAAVGQAVRRIRERQADVILAGGIDSYHDFWLLDRLDADYRVKSSSNLDSFVPGEGAGFVCLAAASVVRDRGLTPLARVSPAAEGFEEGHFGSDKPYRGEGLADTFARFFTGDAIPGPGPIQEVYSSMNGENFWAKEWGVAFLRNQSAFHPDHGMHHPADCYGDVGAACGPLLVGLAAIGLQKAYRRSPCLAYCSSDNGPRTVLAVSATETR
ncbi:MAG TPA: beta-ketoacyl synthase N-terminal-like domain-containing protein, partial [Isosphaeraceae bacterium]|nr:beta-ketoacyl synthase N-terminal-like domain-containing protein [Isosphaeraceae bacterium]